MPGLLKHAHSIHSYQSTRSAPGRIKRSAITEEPIDKLRAEPTGEPIVADSDDQAVGNGAVLQEYREQADALKEALAKVVGIQEQSASVTQQRQILLDQRQTLLDSFEDENAVAELSKLATRVEMCEAKLVNLAAQLSSAQDRLKEDMANFSAEPALS